jgi:hypothetical protein
MAGALGLWLGDIFKLVGKHTYILLLPCIESAVGEGVGVVQCPAVVYTYFIPRQNARV